jgi:hypothetical protein
MAKINAAAATTKDRSIHRNKQTKEKFEIRRDFYLIINFNFMFMLNEDQEEQLTKAFLIAVIFVLISMSVIAYLLFWR